MENWKVDKRLLMEFRLFTAFMSLFAATYLLGIVMSFVKLGVGNVGAWLAAIGFGVGIYGDIRYCLKVTTNGIKFAKNGDEELMRKDWEIFTKGLWHMLCGIIFAVTCLAIAVNIM